MSLFPLPFLGGYNTLLSTWHATLVSVHAKPKLRVVDGSKLMAMKMGTFENI
jgi:hypothetical protein